MGLKAGPGRPALLRVPVFRAGPAVWAGWVCQVGCSSLAHGLAEFWNREVVKMFSGFSNISSSDEGDALQNGDYHVASPLSPRTGFRWVERVR